MGLSILRKVAGQGNILTIPRVFIEIAGDHESALFLSQCIYWYDKMGRPFYKTYQDWEQELGLSRYALDKARKNLAGIITTELKLTNGAPVLHYAVDYDAIEARINKITGSQPEEKDELVGPEATNPVDPHLSTVSKSTFVDGQQIHDLSKVSKTYTVDYHRLHSFEKIQYEDVDDDGLELPKKIKTKSSIVYELARAIGEVCHIEFSMNEKRLLKEAHTLAKKPDISPELVRQLYSTGGAWYKYDWRGRKKQPPRPELIKETILIIQKTDEGLNDIRGDVRNR